MTKKITFISEEEAHTEAIASSLADIVQAGDVITLTGELGVGKTHFTKGLAKGLGITERVTSPTFTIVKEYEGRLPLYHLDVYRLEHSDEDIGFDEYFYGDGVAVIEWAQFIGAFLPEEYLSITIERTGDTAREITVEAVGKKYEPYIEKLEEALGRFVK